MRMSDEGRKILQEQANLAEYYKYKKLQPNVAFGMMDKYISTLPTVFWDKSQYTPTGAQVISKNYPIATLSGTVFASTYKRIVIGHYGAFIEIADDDINRLLLKVKEGQEYRINDPNYTDKVKYEWWTVNDDSDCKLYFQKRTVDYADYKPGFWYISPFEAVAVR